MAAISVTAAFAVIVAFASAVIYLAPDDRPTTTALATEADTDVSTDFVLAPPREESARHVFPFSVIRGGVYSSEELAAAISADPHVAEHYHDITPQAMHAESVGAAREAYMSYRIGDRIYWTKRKLRLHQGEQILTDGAVTIRARCGNRLSEQPVLPTSDAEPPAEAFERGDDASPVTSPDAEPAQPGGTEPPLTLAALPPIEPGMEPLSNSDPWAAVPFLGGIGSFGGVDGGLPLADNTVGGPVVERGEKPLDFVFPSSGLGPGGEGSSPGGSPDSNHSGDTPGSNPHDGPPGPNPHDGPQGPNPHDGPPGPNPPGGGGDDDPASVIVEIPGLTSPHSPEDDFFGGGSDGDLPGDSPPRVLDIFDGSQEQPPTVAPEPTSLTLFGTGAVWLALKRYRRRSRSDSSR